MTYLVTIPAYNEAGIIGHTLEEVSSFLEKTFPNLIQENQIKICVAINGSTDETEEIVKQFRSKIPYITYTVTIEKGRGAALSNTWKDAAEDILLYIDSDLAYSLDDLKSMISAYKENSDCDLAVASRRVKGSIVVRSPVRTVLTEGYNCLIKLLFLNKFTDAQSGCKSIRRTVYRELRDKVCIYKGWFFDTALLIYAEKRGYVIQDLRITCIDNRKWRLSIFRTVLYFLRRLMALRVKTWFVGYR